MNTFPSFEFRTSRAPTLKATKDLQIEVQRQIKMLTMHTPGLRGPRQSLVTMANLHELLLLHNRFRQMLRREHKKIFSFFRYIFVFLQAKFLLLLPNVNGATTTSLEFFALILGISQPKYLPH